MGLFLNGCNSGPDEANLSTGTRAAPSRGQATDVSNSGNGRPSMRITGAPEGSLRFTVVNAGRYEEMLAYAAGRFTMHGGQFFTEQEGNAAVNIGDVYCYLSKSTGSAPRPAISDGLPIRVVNTQVIWEMTWLVTLENGDGLACFLWGGGVMTLDGVNGALTGIIRMDAAE